MQQTKLTGDPKYMRILHLFSSAMQIRRFVANYQIFFSDKSQHSDYSSVHDGKTL